MTSLVSSIFEHGSVLANLEDAVQAAFVVRAFNAAALTLFLWDVLLNLGREIRVVWTARLTVIKCLFLVNRYLAPLPMAVHIWTFSGMAHGLSDTNCRIIYSFASVAELLSISFVSLVVAIRLYAVHELSSRALYTLITFWFITFIAMSALTIPNLWLRLNLMQYVPSFNLCALAIPRDTFWLQLFPKVLEHGFLCIFLIVNAMRTPRTSQTAMLAVLYKSGILYYAITFIILVTTMLAWRFSDPLYLGLTAYTTGLLLTLLTSRLLLSMENSDPSNDLAGRLDDEIPLSQSSHRQQISFEKMLRYHRSQTLHNSQKNHIRDNSRTFDTYSRSSSRASSTVIGQEDITVRVQETRFRKRAWWLLGAKYGVPTVETRVIIDRLPDVEAVDTDFYTVKVSRLGRYSWL